jgi:hypothetical protein
MSIHTHPYGDLICYRGSLACHKAQPFRSELALLSTTGAGECFATGERRRLHASC